VFHHDDDALDAGHEVHRTAHALSNRSASGAAADLSRPAIADFSSCRKPMYPQADITAGHEGTVTLSFLVDTDGTVADSKVLYSTGFAGLDMAAQQAIHKCRFLPALRHGRSVRAWTAIQYIWTLG
jgi:D-alanyl-D-alanine endopeptidase (penicillin-binding protein 7)